MRVLRSVFKAFWVWGPSFFELLSSFGFCWGFGLIVLRGLRLWALGLVGFRGLGLRGLRLIGFRVLGLIRAGGGGLWWIEFVTCDVGGCFVLLGYGVVWGSGFRLWGLGFGVWGLGCRVWSLWAVTGGL